MTEERIRLEKVKEIAKSIPNDYGYYPNGNWKSPIEEIKKEHQRGLNCSDRDRVPSNAEKIDEKTVRMKVKKD